LAGQSQVVYPADTTSDRRPTFDRAPDTTRQEDEKERINDEAKYFFS
jgi:hypothetical protein